MDLNRKFNDIMKSQSPRPLRDDPIERSENYAKRVEKKRLEMVEEFEVPNNVGANEEELKSEYCELLDKIRNGSVGIKESILDSFELEQKEASSYDKLNNAIDGIENKTGWSQKSVQRKGFWGGVWSKMSKTLRLESDNKDKVKLKRVYGKLLALKNQVSPADENGIKENLKDILSFELTCAGISDLQSEHDLTNKMMGATSFDKLDNVIDHYSEESTIV